MFGALVAESGLAPRLHAVAWAIHLSAGDDFDGGVLGQKS